jgi:hypothetical protein
MIVIKKHIRGPLHEPILEIGFIDFNSLSAHDPVNHTAHHFCVTVQSTFILRKFDFVINFK